MDKDKIKLTLIDDLSALDTLILMAHIGAYFVYYGSDEDHLVYLDNRFAEFMRDGFTPTFHSVNISGEENSPEILRVTIAKNDITGAVIEAQEEKTKIIN